MWRNPRNGFGSGRIAYMAELTCVGDFGQGADKAFALLGKAM
jgi:hypothetical protein